MPPVIESILSAALALLMLCGFLLLFAGFARSQHVTYVAVTVLVLYCTALIGFWAAGDAVQARGALFARIAGDGAGASRFLFFALVVAVAVVIPAGALMERWRLSSAAGAGLLLSATVYPLAARWVWSGGWLAGLGPAGGLGHGVVDFAGSGVVHLAGGCVALAGTMAVGPRTGKFSRDGQPLAMPGHSVPMFSAGGLLILAGWFGLAIGFALPQSTASAGVAAANAVLAAAGAVLSAIGFMRWRLGATDPSLISNALVAGIVSISAGAPFVSPASALVIGAVSAPLVITSVLFIERRRLDDPAGTISVHGAAGAWGLLAAGLMADGRSGDGWNGVQGTVRGLFSGGASQLAAQGIGTLALAALALGGGFVVFFILDRMAGNRVSRASEIDGLDAAELGTAAYPDFATSSRDSQR
jgi:Amt family ammonium transporter